MQPRQYGRKKARLGIPPRGLNGILEGLEEARPVLLGERGPTACNLSCVAQVGHEISRGEGHADAVGSKWFAVVIDGHGPLFQTAVGERNIPRDHDVAGPATLGDPIVCRVEVIPDHNAVDQRAIACPQLGVADQMDGKAVALGHADHFIFYGARIPVDVDFQSNALQRRD